MNPWHILQIDPTDDEKTIKRAYSKLIRIHRPDEDIEKFQEIRTAYEQCLSIVQNKNQPKSEHNFTPIQIHSKSKTNIKLNEIDQKQKRNASILEDTQKSELTEQYISALNGAIEASKNQTEITHLWETLFSHDALFVWSIKSTLKTRVAEMLNNHFCITKNQDQLTFSLPIHAIIKLHQIFKFDLPLYNIQKHWFYVCINELNDIMANVENKDSDSVLNNFKHIQLNLFNRSIVNIYSDKAHFIPFLECMLNDIIYKKSKGYEFIPDINILLSHEIFKDDQCLIKLKNDIKQVIQKNQNIPPVLLYLLLDCLSGDYDTEDLLNDFKQKNIISPPTPKKAQPKGKSQFGCTTIFIIFMVISAIVRIANIDNNTNHEEAMKNFNNQTPEERLLKLLKEIEHNKINNNTSNNTSNNEESARKMRELFIGTAIQNKENSESLDRQLQDNLEKLKIIQGTPEQLKEFDVKRNTQETSDINPLILESPN